MNNIVLVDFEKKNGQVRMGFQIIVIFGELIQISQSIQENSHSVIV